MRHITLFVAIIALWTAAAAQTAAAGNETTSARHEAVDFTVQPAHPQLLHGSRHTLDPDHDRDMMKARDDMEREHQQRMREHEQQMREHELQLREQHKVAPQATGETFTADGIKYIINSDNNSVTVTYTQYWTSSSPNYNGGSGNLIIPEKVFYNGKYYTVTAIGDYAFYWCSGFTGSLNIPNSVTEIGNYAFYHCSGFTGSLNIPNSVTSIGNYAFAYCSGFTGSLTIGNSVTSIGNNAFEKCSRFTGSLNIPNTVTSIGNYAFYYCSGFNGSLNIPNSVTSIGERAFNNCSGFTGSLNIPNSVTSIGEWAFGYCRGFTGSLNIPNSVTSIGNYAFAWCSGFTGSLNIPNSVTAIGDGAFYNCSGFTGSLTIPNSVTEIGGGAFDGCKGFTGSLTIPNSVTEIGNGAFNYCKGFTGSLNIPNSVTSIGNYAFYYCTGFTGSLTIPNSVTAIGNYAFYKCSGFTGSLNIPGSVTAIGDAAFSRCSGFTGITVEAGNKVYDSRNNCNAIIVTATNTLISGCKNSIIPNSVTAIGEGAFYNCSGFTGSLTIPNSVISIGNSAFEDCSGFNGELDIPSSVTSIGNSAFSGCSGFTGSLNIPNSVTAIGYAAFYGCSGFTGSLNIPGSVTAIGNSAFGYCNGISLVISNCPEPPSVSSGTFNYVYATLQVPSGCVPVYRNAEVWKDFSTITDKQVSQFESDNLIYTINEDNASVTLCGPVNKAHITNLIIPDAVSHDGKSYPVTIIRGYAFDSCSGITGSLNIPNSVTSIGDAAFFLCSGFTGSLNIPGSVTAIGDRAFSGCSGFTGTLTIPNSVTSIGYAAFYQCSGFTGSLTIPNSVTAIGERAFYNCSGFTGSLTIPNSVSSIGNSAFSGCSGINSVFIPSSVNTIGTEVFNRCSGIDKITVDPENKTFDSRNNCNAINETQSNTLLYGCHNTVIPNDIVKIGNSAFYGHTRLASIVIPESVNVIDYLAFYGDSTLTKIICYNPLPPAVNNTSSFIKEAYSNATVFVPKGSVDAYKAANIWKNFINISGIENQLYTDSVYDFFGGEDVVVAVKMRNSMEVAGFQTDIQLPYSMSFVTDSDGYPEIYLSDRASRSHTLGVTSLSGNKVRVLSYSSTNKLYSGNDGDILYFKVKTNWDASIQTYNVTLSNGEIVSPDGTKYAVDKTDIALRCYYIPGDANHDKKVSIADIIAEARYILLQNPYPFHYKSANVNEDNNVSVADIVVTANIILGRYNPDIKFNMPRIMGGDVLSADVVESRGDGGRTIAIALDGSTGYTAFQADLSLPAGMEVTGARLSDRAGRSHSVAMNHIDGNTVRVLSYATDNATFADNSGDLLLLDVKGHGNIEMTNALFAEPNGCEHELEDMTISTELSGINDITVGNGPVNVYNTAGQLVRRNANPETATQGLPAGFYLVGNKKVVVR